MEVPTVERELLPVTFCSMATAGLIPTMESTSGLSKRPKNWRAYEDRLSTYLLWPSAKSVLKAKLLFPEPLNPVSTTSLFLGIETEMFFKLCTRAPLIMIWVL